MTLRRLQRWLSSGSPSDKVKRDLLVLANTHRTGRTSVLFVRPCILWPHMLSVRHTPSPYYV
jgi:hypothetical protein